MTNYQMTFPTILIFLTLPIIKQGSSFIPVIHSNLSIIHSNLNQHSSNEIVKDASLCDGMLKDTSIGSNLCPCRNLKQIQIDLHPYDRNLPESTLVCCNVSSLKEIGACHAKTNSVDADSVVTTHLIIERSPKLEGNFSLELFLKTFNISPSSLEYLRVSGTNLSKLSICKPTDDKLNEGENVGIQENSEYVCDQLLNFQHLDVRNNQLSQLEASGLSNLADVYLSGNCWKCFDNHLYNSNNIDTVNWLSNNTNNFEDHIQSSDSAKYTKPAFHDASTTFCDWTHIQKMNECSKRNMYFGTCDLITKSCGTIDKAIQKKLPKRRKLLDAITVNERVAKDCPKEYRCVCTPFHTGEIGVVCRNASLTQLPKILPFNTVSLDVRNNKITSLKEIHDNEHYKYLKRLYASNNLIESIAELNGSALLKNYPREIDLQLNKLKKFELPYIKSMFEIRKGKEDISMVTKRFGEFNDVFKFYTRDGFSCDCSDIKEIKRFLIDYAYIIQDASIYECKADHVFFHSTKPTSDPYGNDLNILKMDVASICGGMENDNEFNLLILIFLEGVLFILIVTKLVYDIWRYNTTGEIPWLARQICMGEICHGFKDCNTSGGGWSRNTSNHHCRNSHKTQYDIESPSYNNFYKLAAWKHMFWNSKNDSCPSFEEQNLNIQDNELDYMDTIQFRPRRQNKPPSLQDGCKLPRSYSKRFGDYNGPRKLSDTLSSCLKKNESFIDTKQDDKSSDNITTSFNVDIEIPRKVIGTEDSGSAHSEIINIRIDNPTLSSHHQIVDRKRKITNVPPHVDAILLSKVDDYSSEKICEQSSDTSTSYETIRKASDVSNSSKLSCGSPKPKRGGTSPLIEYKSDNLGVATKSQSKSSGSNLLSPFVGCNGDFKPICSIKDPEDGTTSTGQRKESSNSNNSSCHGNYPNVFEPIPDEDTDIVTSLTDNSVMVSI